MFTSTKRRDKTTEKTSPHDDNTSKTRETTSQKTNTRARQEMCEVYCLPRKSVSTPFQAE